MRLWLVFRVGYFLRLIKELNNIMPLPDILTQNPVNPTWGNSPVYTGQQNPKVQTTQGGVNVSYGTTTLDKIIAASLSGFALWKGAGYVPTTEQPQPQPQQVIQYVPTPTNNSNSSSSDGSFGGKAEKFITENSTLLLGLAGVLVLVQMKPLSRKNPLRQVQNGIKAVIK